MPRYIERSRHGLYYLRLPKHLAHLNEGKRVSLHTHSKRICSGQPIPDSGLSFSSATAGGSPSLN